MAVGAAKKDADNSSSMRLSFNLLVAQEDRQADRQRQAAEDEKASGAGPMPRVGALSSLGAPQALLVLRAEESEGDDDRWCCCFVFCVV